MDLALYYSDHTHKSLQATPTVGDYCGLLCDDGSYYRVKILEFSRPLGLFFHHKEQAKVSGLQHVQMYIPVSILIFYYTA